MRWMSRGVLADALAELVSPTRCASCERPGALICDRCLREIERIDPAHACARCGAPFGDVLCTECGDEGGPGEKAARHGRPGERVARIRLDAPTHCLAAAVFDGPPARIVRAYKDGGERRLAQPIAQIMVAAAWEAERVAPKRYPGVLSRAEAVTFVPVTAAAYRRRGFDHMELIARWVAKIASVPYCDALVKHGRIDQRDLARDERRSLSRGVYRVVAPEIVEGRRILLLDDVITTGSTVSAASAALMDAGAACVDVLAFSRVWG